MIKNKLSVELEFSTFKKIPIKVLEREIKALLSKSGFDFNFDDIKITEVKKETKKK